MVVGLERTDILVCLVLSTGVASVLHSSDWNEWVMSREREESECGKGLIDREKVERSRDWMS